MGGEGGGGALGRGTRGSACRRITDCGTVAGRGWARVNRPSFNGAIVRREKRSEKRNPATTTPFELRSTAHPATQRAVKVRAPGSMPTTPTRGCPVRKSPSPAIPLCRLQRTKTAAARAGFGIPRKIGLARWDRTFKLKTDHPSQIHVAMDLLRCWIARKSHHAMWLISEVSPLLARGRLEGSPSNPNPDRPGACRTE